MHNEAQLELDLTRTAPNVTMLRVGQRATHDVPQMLRNLADSIEAGEHGDVVRLAYVIRVAGTEPIVGAMGVVEHISQAYQDFHAGAAQLMSMSHPGR